MSNIIGDANMVLFENSHGRESHDYTATTMVVGYVSLIFPAYLLQNLCKSDRN